MAPFQADYLSAIAVIPPHACGQTIYFLVHNWTIFATVNAKDASTCKIIRSGGTEHKN